MAVTHRENTESSVRPVMTELTSLGAAMAAGSAAGIEVWNMDSIKPVPCDSFKPRISEDERDQRYSKWKMAVERSFNWDNSKM
ncbi:unnamed protein product [Timema podura]|uniref:Glycerol kinase n=1 Tax=Timema podura TaxID=61482 RepID=A0ABN7NZ52_TIMPD|nr:unnamed protein product [Timema podura]